MQSVRALFLTAFDTAGLAVSCDATGFPASQSASRVVLARSITAASFDLAVD